jgi:hypothetical protein
MTGRRYALRLPFSRPDSVDEHEQNYMMIAERFNALPVDAPMITLKSAGSAGITTVATTTTTNVELPPTIVDNYGFTLISSTVLRSEVAGWYQFSWDLAVTIGGLAGYRQSQLAVLSGSEYLEYNINFGSSLYLPANGTIIVLPGSVAVPLLPNSLISVQGYHDCAGNQDMSIGKLSGIWLRPLEIA